MSIKGNIQTFYLSSLLQLLSNDKKTGVLRVGNGNDTIEIYLSDGTIVFASSSLEEERLGNFLVNEGLVEKSIVENCLKNARLSGKKIGDVLVAGNHIQPDTLSQAVFQQIEFMIYNLFLWEQGEFEYEDCTINLPENTSEEFDTMELILEASRRIDEIAVLKKHLPQNNAVLRLKPGIDVESLNLNDNERPVLHLVNNRRTVSALINDSGYDDFSVYKVLYSLISAGIVESSDSGATLNYTFSEKSTHISIPQETGIIIDGNICAPPAEESCPAQKKSFHLSTSRLLLSAGIMLCLVCTAGAVYMLSSKSAPPGDTPQRPALQDRSAPETLTVHSEKTFPVESPGRTLKSDVSLPPDNASQNSEIGITATQNTFNLIVFKSADNSFSMMLPGLHTRTDKSTAEVCQYVFTFNPNVKLNVRTQPWRAAWVPEDEMFRRILDIQEAGGSAQTYRVDNYTLITLGGAKGYAIEYTNNTATLPYKIHTYALVRSKKAVFIDIFHTNFRNPRIREFVDELQKLIITTLVILV